MTREVFAPGSLSIRNPVALWTLVKREMKRTWVVINQVVWPPIITTVLYVFVFGLALGSRIGNTQGVPYAAFLIPGLIMLQVIDAAYGEAGSSVFQGRFLNHIQEMLISPMSALEIVLGFVIAGIARCFLIAGLITGLGLVLVHIGPQNWPLYALVVGSVAVLFTSIGIIFGLWAEKFDHIAIFTTFVITPLVFVGGVFTSIRFLPPLVQKLSLFNPMFYMIDAFRYSFTGRSDVGLEHSLTIVIALALAAFGLALGMTAAGYKLRA
jgi:ABC-2 type transport system permease protein